MEKALPSIPVKRYFTIGEVSELCGVKPHVLRYWEQEFTQLKPMKRRGNRRYYQHHEVLLIRRIRELLYEEGFTISGARNRLGDALSPRTAAAEYVQEPDDEALYNTEDWGLIDEPATDLLMSDLAQPEVHIVSVSMPQMRDELLSIRKLLLG
jgi:DNA-binding transcriptional MerR regulator